MYKIETFIPESALQDIRKALLFVDAGHIGNYRGCMSYSPESMHAFRTSSVTGVWYSGEASNPMIGTAGEWSEEPELRVEVNVEDAAVERTIKAIRDAHPYEEPVINCLKLFAPV